MRSAPGEPIARVDPSSWRPTTGAMLDSRRDARRHVAGGRVELLLAEAVVEPDAGAGGDHAGAVARRHRERARGAVGVGDRHVRRRARLEDRPVVGVDPVEPRARRGREVGGDLQDLAPVAEDRALHPDQVLDVVGVPRPPRSILEEPQHGCEDHAAHRRGRGRRQAPAGDARGQRLADDGRVRRQVGAPQQAAAGAEVGRDRVGEVALVEGTRTVGGDLLQRRREVGHHDPVLGEPTRRVVQRCVARRVPPEDRLVHVAQVVARRRAQGEAAPRHVDGRCRRARPRGDGRRARAPRRRRRGSRASPPTPRRS